LFIIAAFVFETQAEARDLDRLHTIKLVKEGGFAGYSPKGVRFKKIYAGKNYQILTYIFINPENQHGNYALVVLHHGHLSHTYGAENGEFCRAVKTNLRRKDFFAQHAPDDRDEVIPIKRILSGHWIRIDGNIEIGYGLHGYLYSCEKRALDEYTRLSAIADRKFKYPDFKIENVPLTLDRCH
jgi:hypothetical protein